MVDADLELVSELPFAGVGCPWEFQCCLPQWRTEQILAELGGVVERGVAATSMEERDDGVLIRLERADGTSTAAEAAWVIGAAGAHSVMRASMAEVLEGFTYPGTALVADVRVRCDLARDASKWLPLPRASSCSRRYRTSAGSPSLATSTTASWHIWRASPSEVVAAAIGRRIAAYAAVEDVGWAASFRMHQRMVPRLAQGRRFLLGDAGHLSSPFGGEGLNAGLHDAQDIAWKLALAARGHARPALLESFAIERLAADHHVLEVSGRVDGLVRAAVEAARTGVRAIPATPAQRAALARSRCLLDVTYAGSPLVGEHLGPGVEPPPPPGPGDRFPARTTLTGTAHDLLIFGTADAAGVERLHRRWRGLVDIVRDTGGPPAFFRRAAGAAGRTRRLSRHARRRGRACCARRLPRLLPRPCSYLIKLGVTLLRVAARGATIETLRSGCSPS